MFRSLLLLFVFLPFSVGIPNAEIIDRVLAVVDEQIITLSDVRAAHKFGLVPADVSEDPIDAALKRLIERRLMLGEVERYAPPEPPQAAVDARLAAIRGRFKDPPAFETALKQSPMSTDELRRYVRDSLRIEDYISQRFASSLEPSNDEIARYHRDHASEFSVNGVLRPLEAVRDQVRARVIEERRAAAVRDWIEGLRRRASVVVLYLPGR